MARKLITAFEQLGKIFENQIDAGSDIVGGPQRMATDLKILVHGHHREDAASFGRMRQPGANNRSPRSRGDLFAAKEDSSGARRNDPPHRSQRPGLSTPLSPH